MTSDMFYGVSVLVVVIHTQPVGPESNDVAQSTDANLVFESTMSTNIICLI